MAVAHPVNPPSGKSWDSKFDLDPGPDALFSEFPFRGLPGWGTCVPSFSSLLISEVEKGDDLMPGTLVVTYALMDVLACQ